MKKMLISVVLGEYDELVDSYAQVINRLSTGYT